VAPRCRASLYVITMAKQAYKRVLVKLTGESFAPPGTFGIEAGALGYTAGQLKDALETGCQIAVVVGAGNLLRGRQLADNPDIRRASADQMGMLATMMNGLALQDTLRAAGIDARLMSGVPAPTICEGYEHRRAIEHLQAGRVVVLAGGTGSPFFTTDTGASLRAAEIGADVMMKATKVDGVFDSDPALNPDARKYESLTYDKVLADQLGVMDLSAIQMCKEVGLPVIVFQFGRPGALRAAVEGQAVGTLVTAGD
jgi:uridylate kinase